MLIQLRNPALCTQGINTDSVFAMGMPSFECCTEFNLYSCVLQVLTEYGTIYSLFEVSCWKE